MPDLPQSEEESRRTFQRLKLKDLQNRIEKHPLEMEILRMKKQKLQEELMPLTVKTCCTKLVRNQMFRLKVTNILLLFVAVGSLISASVAKNELQVLNSKFELQVHEVSNLQKNIATQKPTFSVETEKFQKEVDHSLENANVSAITRGRKGKQEVRNK